MVRRFTGRVSYRELCRCTATACVRLPANVERSVVPSANACRRLSAAQSAALRVGQVPRERVKCLLQPSLSGSGDQVSQRGPARPDNVVFEQPRVCGATQGLENVGTISSSCRHTRRCRNDRPAWTHDGRRIAWRAPGQSTAYDFRWSPADGSGAPELLLKDAWTAVFAPSSSHIGRAGPAVVSSGGIERGRGVPAGDLHAGR